MKSIFALYFIDNLNFIDEIDYISKSEAHASNMKRLRIVNIKKHNCSCRRAACQCSLSLAHALCVAVYVRVLITQRVRCISMRAHNLRIFHSL